MRRDQIPAGQARLVTPRALRVYAQALGWQKVDELNGTFSVFHRPDSKAHQILIPLDDQLDDYAEMVADVILRLAEFEKRPTKEVLDHLLLPPSDLLHFRDSGPDAADGTLPLGQAVEWVSALRKALLAGAHSVLQPLPFHPRLSRGPAERFVNACRFGQTLRGSFTLVLACPLDAVPSEADLFEERPPFTRRVTGALMETLAHLADAGDQGEPDELLGGLASPFLSANLCEALVQMRPPGDRPSLTVSAAWSRALPPADPALPLAVHLAREAFAVAEYLAPRLRSTPHPQPDWFIGFVDVLRGLPGPDNHPSGEVLVTIIQDDELIRASLDLAEGEYAIANTAHMTNSPVQFRGVLYRASRVSRVDGVTGFQRIEPGSTSPATQPLARPPVGGGPG